MRLLLYEQLSPVIAEQLRARGHDVEAVAERAWLASLRDDEVFASAIAERRAVVTNNVPDYVMIFRRLHSTAVDHYGLLLTDDRRMPRDRRAFGRFVIVLERFLAAHPAEDALRNQMHWLAPR